MSSCGVVNNKKLNQQKSKHNYPRLSGRNMYFYFYVLLPCTGVSQHGGFLFVSFVYSRILIFGWWQWGWSVPELAC